MGHLPFRNSSWAGFLRFSLSLSHRALSRAARLETRPRTLWWLWQVPTLLPTGYEPVALAVELQSHIRFTAAMLVDPNQFHVFLVYPLQEGQRFGSDRHAVYVLPVRFHRG
jgi:hypothetical protein